jgi:hypothetical protein
MAVNSYLMSLARQQFEKSAVVPPGGDPSMGGGAPPVDPSMAQPAAPVDPAAAAMGAAPPPSDPASAMAAMGGMSPAPAPMPPATPTGAPGQQKLKPEQMMQMLDYRLYNMQQQLTAIMNAMGVQVAPESLVLPPGTTGAPPAETALPGGPMAPPPAAPGGAPGGAPGAAPMDPAAAGAAPPDMAKGAEWTAAGLVDLHTKAAATAALRRSLSTYAG